jgi:hypothetical protein
MPRAEFWLALFTGFLVLETYFAIKISSNTDKSLGKASEAAEKANDLNASGLRAWIAPTRFAFVNLADAEDPLKVRVFYQNVGRSPARELKSWVNVGYIAEPPPLPPAAQWAEIATWHTQTILQPKEMCSHMATISKTSVAYPSSTSGFSIDASRSATNNITIPVDAVRNQKAIYVVLGCFSYETAGSTRYSSFCAFLTPEGGGGKDLAQWGCSACPVGNDDWSAQ